MNYVSDKQICLSPEVALPLSAVTGKFGVFGVSGSGKTYTASVLAEEILLADIS